MRGLTSKLSAACVTNFALSLVVRQIKNHIHKHIAKMFQQKSSKNRMKNWSERETQQLIAILTEPEIRMQVDRHTSRRKAVWEEISVRLYDYGCIARTGIQIYNKIKDLKKKYKKMNDNMKKSGTGVIVQEVFPWYYEVHAIMGDRPAIDPPAGQIGESAPLDCDDEEGQQIDEVS